MSLPVVQAHQFEIIALAVAVYTVYWLVRVLKGVC
jgi:hypothetical protein